MKKLSLDLLVFLLFSWFLDRIKSACIGLAAACESSTFNM